MPGRRLLVPAILALAFVASSYAATTARAAGTCIAKPNAAAPQGEHWYYRTDRVNNRQCWYLGPIGTGVQKSTTRVSRPPANARAILKALLRAQRPVGTDREPARAAIAAEANVGVSALAGPPKRRNYLTHSHHSSQRLNQRLPKSCHQPLRPTQRQQASELNSHQCTQARFHHPALHPRRPQEKAINHRA